MKKIKNLKKWIESLGLSYQPIGNRRGTEFHQIGILISTDYEGPYPSKEIYELHQKITTYAEKHGFRAESCSMRVGIRLYY